MKAHMWVWMMIAIGAANVSAEPPKRPESLEVAEGVEWVEVSKAYRGGAMTVLDDGRILMVFTRPGNLRFPLGTCKLYTIVSRDAGKTWQDERPMMRADGVALSQNAKPYNAGRPTLLRTRDGRIGVFYFGFVKAETKCDLWVTWSADKGKTWTAPQLLFDKAYHPGPRGAVELNSGRIVLVFHYTSTEKGRWSPPEKRGRNVCASLVSDDGGKTWKLSPSVDVGKGVQHAGAMEPTVMGLSNGHLWMVIRTHHGAYWESFSKDEGLSWSQPVATDIEIPKPVGGSPCAPTRLASGRLAMVWNPRIPGPLDRAPNGSRSDAGNSEWLCPTTTAEPGRSHSSLRGARCCPIPASSSRRRGNSSSPRACPWSITNRANA